VHGTSAAVLLIDVIKLATCVGFYYKQQGKGYFFVWRQYCKRAQILSEKLQFKCFIESRHSVVGLFAIAYVGLHSNFTNLVVLELLL
jgi:hypothetical protein